ncbi:MAG TPA: metalloregulator ArsR/SmtB family transcription factor [Solirubrobacteraceae bacterium]|nr:metalloregulator ArsR/SmtB family transcription factor [Solirubrobacteraceae bacterium]
MPDLADRAEKIPHPPTSALDLATIMRALGDPVRLEIVRLLADGRPRLCGELSSTLAIPTSTGSYHLRLLREAGLTRSRAHGTQRYVSLRGDDLEERFPGLVAVLTGS